MKLILQCPIIYILQSTFWVTSLDSYEFFYQRYHVTVVIGGLVMDGKVRGF